MVFDLFFLFRDSENDLYTYCNASHKLHITGKLNPQSSL